MATHMLRKPTLHIGSNSCVEAITFAVENVEIVHGKYFKKRIRGFGEKAKEGKV